MYHSLFFKYAPLSSLHIFTYARNAQFCISNCWNSTNIVLQSQWKEQSPSCSVFTRSCPTLCNPMNCSTPGLPVYHQLLEFTQTHVHWVGDAILCCPLLLLPSIYPSIRVFSNESAVHIQWPKYQLFKWVGSSHQVAEVSASTSVLPMNTQDWSPLKWTGWIPSQSKGLSRLFSYMTVQKHQFFSAQPSL